MKLPCRCGKPWSEHAVHYPYPTTAEQDAAADTITDRLVTAILQTAGEDGRRPNDRFEWYGSALEMAEGILAALADGGT